MDDQARHRWIASHILPLESQARHWLARHVRSLDASDIDDLIQECYSRIWSVDFGAIHNARSYFYAVLRNLLLEQARHAQIVPMERMGEIDELRIPSHDPGPERHVGARQELERLEALVATLPAQCRMTFELRKIHGLSQREVALKMGLSERTVEKHLARAIDRLVQHAAADEDLTSSAEVSRHGTRAKYD